MCLLDFRFENDQYSKVPLYIFGDFNFRLDSCLLIKVSRLSVVNPELLFEMVIEF